MKREIVTSLDCSSFSDKIIVDSVFSHNFYDLGECDFVPPCFTELSSYNYDIAVLGSSSRSISLSGLVYSLSVSPVIHKIAISSSLYLLLSRHSSASAVLNRHVLDVLPYLEDDDFKAVLSSSRISYVGFNSAYSGICFPSRIFSFLVNKSPVFFDGDPQDIDFLFSTYNIGVSSSLLNSASPHAAYSSIRSALCSSEVYRANLEKFISDFRRLASPIPAIF
jgi:hypothetical protein